MSLFDRKKNISRLYRYNAAYFLPRIPPECRYLLSFDSDEPVFRKENFLEPAVCDALSKRLMSTGSAGKLALRDAAQGPNATEVRTKERNTDALLISLEDIALYRQAFEAIIPQIDDFFHVRLGASEGVQALGYSQGCRYRRHADSCNARVNWLGFIKDWVCLRPTRKISSILFLTDAVDRVTAPNQCTGGDVTFEYLRDPSDKPLTIRPQKGLFVAFPSHPLFSHEVHEVTDGYRITLVEWFDAEILGV